MAHLDDPDENITGSRKKVMTLCNISLTTRTALMAAPACLSFRNDGLGHGCDIAALKVEVGETMYDTIGKIVPGTPRSGGTGDGGANRVDDGGVANPQKPKSSWFNNHVRDPAANMKCYQQTSQLEKVEDRANLLLETMGYGKDRNGKFLTNENFWADCALYLDEKHSDDFTPEEQELVNRRVSKCMKFFKSLNLHELTVLEAILRKVEKLNKNGRWTKHA